MGGVDWLRTATVYTKQTTGRLRWDRRVFDTVTLRDCCTPNRLVAWP